jgi:hypothetical protein
VMLRAGILLQNEHAFDVSSISNHYQYFASSNATCHMNDFNFPDVLICNFNMDTSISIVTQKYCRDCRSLSLAALLPCCLEPVHPFLRLEHRDLTIQSPSACSWDNSHFLDGASRPLELLTPSLVQFSISCG